MKIYLLSILTVVLFQGNIVSQPYAISNIPNQMIQGSHAVVREDKTTFDIVSKSHARLNRKFAVTLLDEGAEYSVSWLYHIIKM